jgi:chromosome segregation and condensation protein ScpB
MERCFASRIFEIALDTVLVDCPTLQRVPATVLSAGELCTAVAAGPINWGTADALAILACRQPLTRDDIQDIRGATISIPTVMQLDDRGWIKAHGYPRAPGCEPLSASTSQFQEDVGLARMELRDL